MELLLFYSKALPTDHYLLDYCSIASFYSDCLHSTLTLPLYQTLSPTAAAAMKIITQLVIMTLSMILVNADVL